MQIQKNNSKYTGMKKNLLLFTIITMAFIGCKKADNFTLDGSIDEQLAEDIAGAQIDFYVREQKKWNVIDSAVIDDNGHFYISANVEEPRVVTLVIEDIQIGQVVFEKGAAECVLNTDGELIVSGTENNDILNKFNLSLIEIESEEEYIAFLDSFIVDNINNVVGQFQFCTNYILFDINRIDFILSLMNEQTQENEEIQFVTDKINVMRRTSKGQPYLDISLPAPSGEQLAISQLVGNTDYLLIDFWASWCGPCRRAMPQMIELYNEFHPSGKLDILGISLDQDEQAWTEAIESLGLVWNHISDLQGWKSDAATLYGVSAIPSTLLIDKDGVIVARNLEPDEYKAIIENQQ